MNYSIIEIELHRTILSYTGKRDHELKKKQLFEFRISVYLVYIKKYAIIYRITKNFSLQGYQNPSNNSKRIDYRTIKFSHKYTKGDGVFIANI